MTNAVLVIGIGNEYRGDGAVGLAVIRALKEKGLQDVTCQECTGDGMTLMDLWEGSNRVILIDALLSNTAPGTIHRFDAHEEIIPTRLSSHSAHAFGVAEAVELAKTLYELPSSLVVYAVEGENFATTIGLTPEVERAVPVAVEQVTREAQGNG